MTSILIWAGLSSLAFMVFFAMILMSILQKRTGMAMIAVVALFIGLATGARAVLLSHAEVIPSSFTTDVHQNGMALYTRMFGAPHAACVEVPKYRERLAPAFEKYECVRARVCGTEVRRIMEQRQNAWSFSASKAAPRPTGNEGAIGEYAPETLDDTVLFVHDLTSKSGAGRWIFCSRDSTALIAVVKYR